MEENDEDEQIIIIDCIALIDNRADYYVEGGGRGASSCSHEKLITSRNYEHPNRHKSIFLAVTRVFAHR